MAVGAPAEWMMSVMWINYMLIMAYGFYTHDRIAAVVNAAYSTGNSPRSSVKTTEYQERGWNPKAEDFDFDEAPFLREADYPAKARTGPSDADELHFDSPLSELPLVREFA
jgi:hypothetical protein